MLPPPLPVLSSSSGAFTASDNSGSISRGATVYVENDGIGHANIEVKGTAFSYRRYDGSYSPASGAYGLLGNEVLLKETHEYAEKRMLKSPTSVYQFPTAIADAIYKHLNTMYNSGTPASHGGMVVGTYYLIGNNCTTITTEALQKGGLNIQNYRFLLILMCGNILNVHFVLQYFKPINESHYALT